MVLVLRHVLHGDSEQRLLCGEGVAEKSRGISVAGTAGQSPLPRGNGTRGITRLFGSQRRERRAQLGGLLDTDRPQGELTDQAKAQRQRTI
ncbi:hypothetical protein D3C78_1351640 [compost metagenome]